jgi:pimeloyl-ACP methyl ester carboxylesterase
MRWLALTLTAAAMLAVSVWSNEVRAAPAEADQTPPWQTLPPPAPLPPFELVGRVAHDGARIWFAAFGTGPPVILLHGGDASSDYWGDQAPALIADHRRVIVIDSRGQGRSTRDARPLGYELMESDVIAVMDELNIDHADVVGWSDGAIIGLIMAMKHPHRVAHVFAFGANMDLHGFNPMGAVSPILPKVEAALSANYARLSETPNDFPALSKAVLAMQLREPNYTPADLAAIEGPQVAIVDGAHEEFILRQHTEYLARTIPGAKLIILPDVSHFAPIQAPDAFNAAMIGFLEGASGDSPAPPAKAAGQGSDDAGSRR